MTKGEKKTGTISAPDEIERATAAMAAKQQFVSAAFDMGWRLALTVIVPVFIGAWLDRRYHTSPSWTLTALVIAIAGACLVVWRTLKAISAQQKGVKK